MSTTIPDISAAIDRLRAGGVVAFPTETVYGLGADALNEAAVRRVFALKGRPAFNPLIVHVSGPDMAARLVAEWTDDAAALARMYWPGPLTMVLPRATAGGRNAMIVPDLVTAGGPTIAVRCPDHPVALSLLFGLETPLVGPSANLSGTVSPTSAAHVRAAFRPDEVLVLEGGPCRTGIESTVVDLSSPRARVLRPGFIGAGEIAAVLGRPVEEPAGGGGAAAPEAGVPLASPGLLARHYAPRSPSRLVDAADVRGILRDFGNAAAVVIAHERLEIPAPHRLIVLPRDAEDYAHGLYAALREADAANPSMILIQRPPPPTDSPLWLAILDRLVRATAR